MKKFNEQVTEIVEEKSHIFSNDEIYVKLREYYDSMKEKGLIVPMKYTLPPLDTIGRRLFQTQSTVEK
jgi:hypothetical protein